jgi:ATP-binding cassette subfamily B protein
VVTIREADLILTFAQGRIVESGTFEALVAGSGIFARLVEAQFIAKTSAPAT